MKRILLFLCTISFTAGAYATGIGANETTASCDNETLGQTSGTANVEIDWQPNTIDIRWYDNNTQITPSNSAANTCIYDDDLYLPAAPTKTGYTFKGWTVKNIQSPTCNIDQLDTSIGFSNYSSLGGNGETSYYYDTTLGLTENSTFAVKFSYGVVYGRGRCSSTSGNNNNWNFDNPLSEWTKSISNEQGLYCWCQVIGFTSAGNDYTKGPLCNIFPESSWYSLDMKRDSLEGCISWCAPGCMFRFAGNSALRSAMYSIVGR